VINNSFYEIRHKSLKLSYLTIREVRIEKIKLKIEDPFVKGLPRKVVLDMSRGMGLKPQVEKNMVDTQFVVI